MGKAVENKLKKYSSILSSSFELFSTKGFSKTSVEDIVKKADVAKGTFYLYFKDKFDLREKLIINSAQKLFDVAIEQSGYKNKESFTDKLCAITDVILNEMARQPLLTKFLRGNISWAVFHKSLEHGRGQGKYDYIGILKEEMGKEEAKYHDPEIMIFMIIELISSTSYSVIVENDPVSPDVYKPHLHGCIAAIANSFKE